MSKVLLITMPSYDRATNYLYSWAKHSIDAAKGYIEIIPLEKDAANRKEFESRNTKLIPVFVVFNGHGNYTTITGQNNEPLVEMDKNDHQFEGRIVYAISCGAAKHLGRSMVNKKAVSFIGYEDDFIAY